MGAEEEDKKEICIQVKLGKEDKGKPCLEKPSPDANWFIWDGIRGTRANQDYQREVEDTSLLDIQSHLAGRRQGKLVRVASNEASSYHSGGSFLRLEQVEISLKTGLFHPGLGLIAKDHGTRIPARNHFPSLAGLARLPPCLSAA